MSRSRFYRPGYEYSESAYGEAGTIYLPGTGYAGVSDRVGYVDSSGEVYRYTGDDILHEVRVGRVDADGIIYDTYGSQVGYVDSDNQVFRGNDFGHTSITARSELVGRFSGDDFREAGAAFLLGVFDGSVSVSGRIMDESRTVSSSFDNSDSHSAGSVGGFGGGGGGGFSGGEVGGSSGGGSAMIYIMFGVLVGIVMLVRWLDSSGTLHRFSEIVGMLSTRFIIGMVFGAVIFIVSMRGNAGLVPSIIQALLGGCAYQLPILAFFVDPPVSIQNQINAFFDQHLFLAILLPAFLLLPTVLDAVFLAIGSRHNQQLRSSYLTMSLVLLVIVTCILVAVFLTDNVAEEGLSIQIMMSFIPGIWFGICSLICGMIQERILETPAN